MNILDPNFKYTNAADTAKPGYLKSKFDTIRRKQREQREQTFQQDMQKVQQTVVQLNNRRTK